MVFSMVIFNGKFPLKRPLMFLFLKNFPVLILECLYNADFSECTADLKECISIEDH